MFDIVREERKIKIGNQKYIMYFDMKSIATYFKLTGRQFNLDLISLFNQEDEAIINFIASIVRKEDDENREPLGKEVIEGDVLTWLFNCKIDAIEIIEKSLPQDDPKKK